MMRSVVVLLLAGCAGADATPDQMGDEAWHRGDMALASAHYLRAGDGSRVLAKRADAALLGGHLGRAAALYRLLAESDPTAKGEAAAGLVRVALAAERAGDPRALADAVLALDAVAPGWPIGRLAARLPPDAAWPAAEVVRLAPAALAGGGGEPWLLALAAGDASLGRCSASIQVADAFRRRAAGAAGAGVDSAVTLRSGCALQLGLEALAGSRPGEAQQWLEEALSATRSSAIGRRALVAIGDALLAQGDLDGARRAWQEVLTAPVPPDSITVRALERLRAPEPPTEVPDSSVVPGPP